MSEKASKSNEGATSSTPLPPLNLQSSKTSHPTPEPSSSNSAMTQHSKPPSHTCSTTNPSSLKRPITGSPESSLSPKKASLAPQQAVTPPRVENVAATTDVTPSHPRVENVAATTAVTPSHPPQQAGTPPRAENVAATSAVTPSHPMQSMQLGTPQSNSAGRVAPRAQVSLNFGLQQGSAVTLPARY